MSLDDFILTCFCVIDEMMPMVIKDQRLRARGPLPKLSDSEVITMEVVGSYLGLAQDRAVIAYFQRHYAHFFPGLVGLHRTTFVRQAANLWAVKERVWCWIRDELMTYDPTMSIIDRVPLPVCRFARAPWCVRIRRRGPLWQGSCGSANVLRLPLACPGELAGGAHPPVLGSSQ